MTITLLGEPDQPVRLERSRDLWNWEPVETTSIPLGGRTTTDPAAAVEPFLFYRAVMLDY